MSRHSDDELERLLADLPPTEDKMERWRREAAEAEERRARAKAEREAEERRARAERTLTETQAAQLEARLVGMINDTREFVLTVVGEALGEYRIQLVDEISASYEDAFAKMSATIEALRAELNLLNAADGKGPIDLPNPLQRRGLN
jgi:regulator of protease activity HflC (stomatin/prohibitin superfamily)